MKYCNIVTQRKNKDTGEVNDSPLHKELINYVGNRKDALKVYALTFTPKFKNKFSSLAKDAYNEVPFTTLESKLNIPELIGESKFINNVSKKYKIVNSDGTLTTFNTFKEGLDKAYQFNVTSPYKNRFVAVLTPEENSKYTIKIQKKTERDIAVTANMQQENALNTKLTSILNSVGLNVGMLSEAEEKLYDGTTSYDQMDKVAEGLKEVIKIASGERGQTALSEEFSHLLISASKHLNITQRVINNLRDSGAYKDILGDTLDAYVEEYNGDENMLAEEALGKLLDAQLRNSDKEWSSDTSKVTTNLFSRFWENLKNIFRKLTESDIAKAQREANDLAGKFTRDVNNNSFEYADFYRIVDTANLRKIDVTIDKEKEFLKSVISTESKRLDILLKLDNNSITESQKTELDRLKNALANDKTKEGILSYLKVATKELNFKITDINKALKEAKNINEIGKYLRTIRNFIDSYKDNITGLDQLIYEEELDGNEDLKNYIKETEALDRVKVALSQANSAYQHHAIPATIDFLTPYIPEALAKNYNMSRKEFAKKITEKADKDISGLSTWVDAMADASDDVLKIIDQVVKQQKTKARLASIEEWKKIDALLVNAEKDGITDFSFMFEKFENGETTGNYISDINWGEYTKDLKEFRNKLKLKYPVPELKSAEIKKEYKEFYSKHLELNDVTHQWTPKASLYRNVDYLTMSEEKKNILEAFLRVKERADALLPQDDNPHKAVQIRKDWLERLKSTSGFTNKSKEIGEAITDAFMLRNDDTDNVLRGTTGFGANASEINFLPIYYRHDLENSKDISTDVASTLKAYITMAENYNHMHDIIDILEHTRDVISQRKIAKTLGGKPVFEVINNKRVPVYMEAGTSNIVKRLDGFFNMQVYGRTSKQEVIKGTNISLGKTANQINKMTALNVYAVNFLGGIANLTVGKMMMRTEAISGEFFTYSNLLSADNIYRKELVGLTSEVGKRIKTSKLALFDEKFNVLQDFEKRAADSQMDRKNRVSSLFSMDTTFFLSNIGEHYMHNRTALSLARATKFLDTTTDKEIDLWDAYEKVYVDENMPSKGAYLKLKAGVVNLDGSKINEGTLVDKFSRKSNRINEKLHGIYNEADRNMLQQYGLGRMVYMFRKWVIPSYRKRFESNHYDFDLEAFQEGYYTTAARFAIGIVDSALNLKTSYALHKDEMTKNQRANLIRAAAELGQYMMLNIVLGILAGYDDKDRSWTLQILEYTLRRTTVEIGALVPTPDIFSQIMTLASQPAAGAAYIDKILTLCKLIFPSEWERLQSGPYKGDTRAYKDVIQVLPFYNQIKRFEDPKQSILFYKRQ